MNTVTLNFSLSFSFFSRGISAHQQLKAVWKLTSRDHTSNNTTCSHNQHDIKQHSLLWSCNAIWIKMCEVKHDYDEIRSDRWTQTSVPLLSHYRDHHLCLLSLTFLPSNNISSSGSRAQTGFTTNLFTADSVAWELSYEQQTWQISRSKTATSSDTNINLVCTSDP